MFLLFLYLQYNRLFLNHFFHSVEQAQYRVLLQGKSWIIRNFTVSYLPQNSLIEIFLFSVWISAAVTLSISFNDIFIIFIKQFLKQLINILSIVKKYIGEESKKVKTQKFQVSKLRKGDWPHFPFTKRHIKLSLTHVYI